MKRLSEDQASAVLADFDLWASADASPAPLTTADMRHRFTLMTLDARLHDAAATVGIERVQITP